MAVNKEKKPLSLLNPVYRESVLISLLVLALSVVWIIYSDRITLQMLNKGEEFLTRIQTYKGLVFVFVSSGLFFITLQWSFKRFDKAEKEAERKEKRYADLLNHLPGISYCCLNDRYWTMTFLNNSVKDLTGFLPEEILYNQKNSYKDLIDPRDREEVDKRVDEAISQGREFRIFYRLNTLNNEIKWVWEQGGIAFFENGKQYLEGYIVDVTEFYEMKEALGVKDTFYKMLLENANDAIFVLEVDVENQGLSKFKEVNRVACDRLNMDKAALLNTHPLDINIFRNIENLGNKLYQFFQTGNVILESGYVDYTGQQRHVEVNAHLFDLNGKKMVLAISRDVTDRILAREFLEEKNAELQTLLYKASHDLRSPITNVIGLVNVAKDEVKENTAHQYLNMLNQSGEQLLYVVESLGSASLSKKQALKIEKIEFESILDNLKDYFKGIPDFQNSHWENFIDVRKPFYSDKTLIETILSNLIHNSLAYKKNEKPYIRIAVIYHDQNLELEVTDDGIGIEPAVQDKVYKMFYRGNNQSSGSGLGLYIVKNSVEKLEGSVSFQSQAGEGTTFKVKLPTLPSE